MMEALVLIEGQDVNREALGISTRGWWTSGLGDAVGGVVLHVMAVSRDNLSNAMDRIAEVPGVTRMLTLALKV